MSELAVEGYTIRQADWQDAIAIQRLINSTSLVHRYLDWRDPLQWLGPQPYLLLEKDHELLAALACPADPDNIAWVRLFACSWKIPLEQAWKFLVLSAIEQMAVMPSKPHCYILALDEWIDLLMRHNQYPRHQYLVILQRPLSLPLPLQNSPHIKIREVTENDLPDVESIDAASFEDLWVYSLPTLQLAYQQSDYRYLAELHGLPVGYLFGTQSGSSSHLARIAVLSEYKRQHIASRLIETYFEALKHHGVIQVTLNTQSDNMASLSLYDKMGFRKTGETFSVYEINSHKEPNP
jgi:ribosomal protein S18 acetylase RimI-like enzyme